MPALRIAPRRSRAFLCLIVLLHLALFGLIAALDWAWWWAALGAASLAWAGRVWYRSADYIWEQRPDGSRFLSMARDGHTAIKVTAAAGGVLSLWVLLAYWQDDKGKVYRTLLWYDSASRQEFKLWLLCLRWQDSVEKTEQQKKAENQWQK